MSATSVDTSVWRQLRALCGMELLLLRRNLATAVLVVVLPLVIGVGRLGLEPLGADEAVVGAERLASAIGLIAAIFVHHHLVTVYAARRQELVLKRLRAGLPAGGTIIAGAATAITVVFVAGLVGSLVETMPGLAVIAGWLALTALAVRSFFRWEPRHR